MAAASRRRGRWLGTGFALWAATMGCALAQDTATIDPVAPPALDGSAPPPAGKAKLPTDAPSTEARKSDSLAAMEILGFDVLVNRANNLFGSSADYRVTLPSIRRNLRSAWVVDNDPFRVNQFMHPYQGSMYHGFARSTGHDYWTSMGYTFAEASRGRSPVRTRCLRATTRSPA